MSHSIFEPTGAKLASLSCDTINLEIGKGIVKAYLTLSNVYRDLGLNGRKNFYPLKRTITGKSVIYS